MPSPVTFALDENGEPVIRLRYECTEASAAQAAGTDAGRPSSVQQITVTASGHPTERIRAANVDSDYAIPQASLDGADGPWTDIAAGSLAVGGVAGDEVNVWIRLLVKRWGTMLSPHIDATLFVGSLEPAAIDEA